MAPISDTGHMAGLDTGGKETTKVSPHLMPHTAADSIRPTRLTSRSPGSTSQRA